MSFWSQTVYISVYYNLDVYHKLTTISELFCYCDFFKTKVIIPLIFGNVFKYKIIKMSLSVIDAADIDSWYHTMVYCIHRSYCEDEGKIPVTGNSINCYCYIWMIPTDNTIIIFNESWNKLFIYLKFRSNSSFNRLYCR